MQPGKGVGGGGGGVGAKFRVSLDFLFCLLNINIVCLEEQNIGSTLLKMLSIEIEAFT